MFCSRWTVAACARIEQDAGQPMPATTPPARKQLHRRLRRCRQLRRSFAIAATAVTDPTGKSTYQCWMNYARPSRVTSRVLKGLTASAHKPTNTIRRTGPRFQLTIHVGIAIPFWTLDSRTRERNLNARVQITNIIWSGDSGGPWIRLNRRLH